MKFDYLIVGAGLFGSVCAQALKAKGKSVLVVDKRNHIGGNCYDENIEGAYAGLYGGHIFHTNSPRIWQYVNEFADWRFYEHRVKIYSQGEVFSFPPNLMTFDRLKSKFGPQAEQEIKERFIIPYSLKQWGKPIDQIPASVLNRIPVRLNYDDRYFSDRFQGIPEKGYTDFISNILTGIPIELNVEFSTSDLDYWLGRAKKIIYSGALDQFYKYELGRLEYRSLTFKQEIKTQDQYIGCATMNFPDLEFPYTKIMEWKNFGWRGEPKGKTVITYEFPAAEGEPYYPVETAENQDLYRRYKEEITKLFGWIKIGGRLGSYRYYNMDQVIAQALAMVRSDYS